MAKPVNEETTQEPQKELTLQERIEAELKRKQDNIAAAKAKAAAEAKEAEELEKLANLPDEVVEIAENIAGLDEEFGTLKTQFEDDVKPYQEKIDEIAKTFTEKAQPVVDARKAEYDKLVAAVGETGAAVIVGKKTVSTGGRKGGKRTGRINGMLVKEAVAKAHIDEGMSFEAIAEKYDIYSDSEVARGGKTKNGYLCSRHMGEMVKDGKVVKNDNGTYSWA